MKSGVSWMAVGLAVVAVGTISTGPDLAQSAATPAGGTRVGVVDLVRVFNEFEQTKVLNEKMQEDRARVAQEADRKTQDIKAEQAALDAFTPDSADWYKRRQKVKKMQLEYEVWMGLEQHRVGEDYLRWTKNTYQMVTDEVAAVARKKGLQLVLTREELDMTVTDPKLRPQLMAQILNRKVVYWDASVDLTEEVLANLNAAFAKAGGATSVKFRR